MIDTFSLYSPFYTVGFPQPLTSVYNSLFSASPPRTTTYTRPKPAVKGTTKGGTDLGTSLGGTGVGSNKESTKGNRTKNTISSSYTDAAVTDSAKDAFSSLGMGAVKGVGTTMGLGLAMGAPIGALAEAAIGPAALGIGQALPGVIGNLAATSLGMDPGKTTVGKMSTSVLGGLLGATLGPVGGILGAVAAPTVVGMVEDALDVRDVEQVRDALESTVGAISGRRMGAAFGEAYGRTKDAHKSFSQAVDTMNVAPVSKQVAKESFARAVGPSLAGPAKNAIGEYAAEIGVAPAAGYAGAMMGLGQVGVDTNPANALDSAVTQAAKESFDNAMASFGGPSTSATSAIGGVTQGQAVANQQSQAAASQTAQTAAAETTSPTSETTTSSAPGKGQTTSESAGSTGTASESSEGRGSGDGGSSSSGGGRGDGGGKGGMGEGGLGGGMHGSDQGGFGTGVGGDIGGGSMSHGDAQGGFGGVGGYGDVGSDSDSDGEGSDSDGTGDGGDSDGGGDSGW